MMVEKFLNLQETAAIDPNNERKLSFEALTSCLWVMSLRKDRASSLDATDPMSG